MPLCFRWLFFAHDDLRRPPPPPPDMMLRRFSPTPLDASRWRCRHRLRFSRADAFAAATSRRRRHTLIDGLRHYATPSMLLSLPAYFRHHLSSISAPAAPRAP